MHVRTVLSSYIQCSSILSSGDQYIAISLIFSVSFLSFILTLYSFDPILSLFNISVNKQILVDAYIHMFTYSFTRLLIYFRVNIYVYFNLYLYIQTHMNLFSSFENLYIIYLSSLFIPHTHTNNHTHTHTHTHTPRMESRPLIKRKQRSSEHCSWMPRTPSKYVHLPFLRFIMQYSIVFN